MTGTETETAIAIDMGRRTRKESATGKRIVVETEIAIGTEIGTGTAIAGTTRTATGRAERIETLPLVRLLLPQRPRDPMAEVCPVVRMYRDIVMDLMARKAWARDDGPPMTRSATPTEVLPGGPRLIFYSPTEVPNVPHVKKVVTEMIVADVRPIKTVTSDLEILKDVEQIAMDRILMVAGLKEYVSQLLQQFAF